MNDGLSYREIHMPETLEVVIADLAHHNGVKSIDSLIVTILDKCARNPAAFGFKAIPKPFEVGKFTTLSQDECDYIGSEISHDMRCELTEQIGLERVRWNNRAMSAAIATINRLRYPEEFK